MSIWVHSHTQGHEQKGHVFTFRKEIAVPSVGMQDMGKGKKKIPFNLTVEVGDENNYIPAAVRQREKKEVSNIRK